MVYRYGIVLTMYNVHPYFPPQNVGKKVHIIHGTIWYFFKTNSRCCLEIESDSG